MGMDYGWSGDYRPAGTKDIRRVLQLLLERRFADCKAAQLFQYPLH